MRLHLQHFLPILAVAAVFSLLAPGTQAAEGTFQRTLSVTGPAELDVSTGSGDITVTVGEPGTIHITGHIKTRSSWLGGPWNAEELVRRIQENPPIEQQGNSIRVGRLQDKELQRNVSISYQLVVPRQTRLNSSTGSGNQNIDGIDGPAEASTGSGDIKLADIGADVDATTGSGSIHVEEARGRLRASTGSGDIHATRIGGSINASTGSGNVVLEQSVPGDVEVSTGSGDVTAHGVQGGLRIGTGSGEVSADGKPTGSWELETSSGDISVRLPAEGGYDIDARTSSGSIYSEHPLTVQGKFGRREVRGKIRGGGVLVSLSTSSGSIRID